MNQYILRNRHFFIIDIIILIMTPVLAIMLRLDRLVVPEQFRRDLLIYIGFAMVIRLVVFYLFRLYRRYWRYASIDELARIAAAVLVSTLIVGGITLLGRWLVGYNLPRSVLLIDGLLVLLAVGGARFSVRLAETRRPTFPTKGTRRVLVMGAGDAGAMVVKEMQRNPRLGLRPVIFADDDPVKQGVQIYGIPVAGRHSDIPHLVQAYLIDQVVIAMPTAAGRTIREIVDLCEAVDVRVKTVPGFYELLDGNIDVRQLRDVDIADLLRREPVETDTVAVQSLLAGKKVLVTGGGGSIGSELCRQIVRCQPQQVLLLGHGENSIFEIYNELRRLAPKGVVITPLIADIRFEDRLKTLFYQYRPDIVFHAAAHKHVPLMEMNPAEAVTNNILGTRNLLAAALAVDVAQFVMISTDKAVNPTNVMGVSKRVAELLVQQAATTAGKPYVAVRFGNVLGSRGSVVFTFKQQIASGGPVTVTHPEMQRYFMTIPEAVQLVLQAAVLGEGAETFLLDMGEPVKIVDMARDMIELSGLELGRDIEIEYVGLRPGEKLFEELFTEGENHRRTRHEKIFVAAQTDAGGGVDLEAGVNALIELAALNDRDGIVRGLQALVPEYQPKGSTPPRPVPFGQVTAGQGKEVPNVTPVTGD